VSAACVRVVCVVCGSEQILLLVSFKEAEKKKDSHAAKWDSKNSDTTYVASEEIENCFHVAGFRLRSGFG
jgi:hypothetical protein